MAVVPLRQVLLPAADVEALAGFLESALGLELQFRDGERWVREMGEHDRTALLALSGGAVVLLLERATRARPAPSPAYVDVTVLQR